MNAKEVFSRVKAVRAAAGDDEAAHSREDSLYEDLLRSIANGTCEDPVTCAKTALLTKKMNFERWCA